MCLPLVKINKYFVAMRGNNDIGGSKKALELLSSEIFDIDSFKLPIVKKFIHKRSRCNIKQTVVGNFY